MLVWNLAWLVVLVHVQHEPPGRIIEVFHGSQNAEDVVGVVEQREWQYLVYGRSVIGAQHRDPARRTQPVFAGFAVMQALRFALPPSGHSLGARRLRVLQLGVGAGTVPSYLRHHGIATDAVEISGRVLAAAARHFGYDDCRVGGVAPITAPISATAVADSSSTAASEQQQQQDDEACPRGRTVVADGGAFLRGSVRREEGGWAAPRSGYDAVLMDLFAGENGGEAFFSSALFARLRRSWLAPRSGILLVNFVGFAAGPHAGAARAVAAALRTVFSHVRAFRDTPPATKPLAPTNIVYFASDAPVAFVLPRGLVEAQLTKMAPLGLRAKQRFQQWELFHQAPGSEEQHEQEQQGACGHMQGEEEHKEEQSEVVTGANGDDTVLFGAAQRAIKAAMWVHAQEMVAPRLWAALAATARDAPEGAGVMEAENGAGV